MTEDIREAILVAQIACDEDNLDRAEDALTKALGEVPTS